MPPPHAHRGMVCAETETHIHEEISRRLGTPGSYLKAVSDVYTLSCPAGYTPVGLIFNN